MATIIIAEDEKIVAKDIENKLQKLGYEISAVVSTGKAVLERVSESVPDLVLMDIKLEGDMDGIEAARKLRDGYDIPVIYLTAYADKLTLGRIAETQPYGYVLKPFSIKELKHRIEIALSKSAER